MEVIANNMLLFWRADTIYSNWYPDGKVYLNGTAAGPAPDTDAVRPTLHRAGAQKLCDPRGAI